MNPIGGGEWKTAVIALSHLERRLNEMEKDGWNVHAMWGGVYTQDPDWDPPKESPSRGTTLINSGPVTVSAAHVVWFKQ